MRHLLACVSAIGMAAGLSAPAATSAEPTAHDGDHRIAAPETGRLSESTRVSGTTTSFSAARGVVRTAKWRDPSDGPIPARDLLRLAIRHNPSTGRIVAQFRLGAPPKRATRAFAMMYIGTIKNGACRARAAVGGRTHRGKSAWIRIAADGSVKKSGGGSANRSGRRVTLRAKARPLRGRKWNCAYAYLNNVSNDSAYDNTGYVRLRKPPRAKLRLSTPDTRTQTSAAVGRWKRVKVRVENDGQADARARGVRVRISEPKGVQVKPRTLEFKPIKPYDERTKRVRIKLKRRDTKTIKLRLAARNAPTRKGRLVIHPKPKPLPKNLVGRYFWGFKSHVSHAWDNYAIAFVSKKHAYIGFPRRGVPKKCKLSTKHCVRYHYNKRTGKLKVGKRKGHYRNGKLTLRGYAGFYPTKLPKPGKRWRVSLTHYGYTMCPGAACTTWTDWLTLRRNGTFTTDRRMVATRAAARGEPGIPNGKGHYRIRRRGHLVLNYKNRKTYHTTIAIMTDKKRRPDVYGAGLFVRGTNYGP
ncbi:MAG: hypothetical protein L0K86_14580 [Actinomycetia bacterium]|nr:hypothetical protein [Actinomycetes bacterium]